MSTEYPLYKDETHEFELCESSSKFTISVLERDDDRFPSDDGICILDFPSNKQLSPEELVEVAVKILQPTLYNVEDPKKFFKEVILKRVNELVVNGA